MALDFLPVVALGFMLIFARVGTMVMLMPALGEQTIPTRVRLTVALALTFVLFPLLGKDFSAIPSTLPKLMFLFLGEFVIGFFIGISARLIMSASSIAGTTIAAQSGLAMAQAFDAGQGQQGALTANFISITAITLIFVLNLHHLMIAALHDSYTMFPPGHMLPVGDMSEYALMSVVDAFRVGIQMAAPFILFGILFNFGLGLLNRLMPQFQVFFVAMPANIFIGFVLLLILLGAIMGWYVDHIAEAIGRFVNP